MFMCSLGIDRGMIIVAEADSEYVGLWSWDNLKAHLGAADTLSIKTNLDTCAPDQHMMVIRAAKGAGFYHARFLTRTTQQIV
jgi:hypothetical protein